MSKAGYLPVCLECGSDLVGKCVLVPACDMVSRVIESRAKGDGAYKVEMIGHMVMFKDKSFTETPPLFRCLSCNAVFTFWQLRAACRKAAKCAVGEAKGGTDA